MLPPCTLCSCFGVCPVAFRFLQILLPFVLCFLLVLLSLLSFWQACEALGQVHGDDVLRSYCRYLVVFFSLDSSSLLF